jgi:filamentous hemagglutinin family protein
MGQVSIHRRGEKRALSRLAAYLKVTAAIVALLSNNAAWAQQLPTGGSVAAGTATIVQPNSSTLNINQSSNQAVINWNSFSVSRGGTVNFNQPNSSSATLNRVTGSTPSWIAGTINAPGTVLLVNPNGIAITKSGVINTGSFAASTLDISNADFMAGKYKFTGNGGSAAVRNSGRINVSDGGFAALLGGQVANDGVISARLGKVGLGAGELITLDLAGDGFLSVAVPSSQMGKLVDASGALVSNRGKIRADGGAVFLTAATASTILRDAVNVPGSIRANTVGTHNGRIVIGGGEGGKVSVTGKLAAKSKTGKGGDIAVTGKEIVLAGARFDASGATGGGTILIGGGLHGAGPLSHAQSLTIDAASVIRADALVSGNGGTIAAWSDGQTNAHGTFSARGGANGGDGGIVETSGRQVDFTGIRVNASGIKGKPGMWLLDPTDLIIDATSATAINGVLGTGTSVTLETSAGGAPTGPAGSTGNTASGNGDILVNSDLTWSTNAVLTLSAFNSVVLNAAINITGPGGLVVNTNNNLGGASSGTGAFTIAMDNGGRVDYGATDNGGTLSINGTPYTLIYTATQFDSIDGVLADGLNTGVPVYGAGLAGNYALATSVGNFGAAGALIKLQVGYFNGTFEGLGNSFFDFNISGGTGSVALFGGINSSGVVRDLKISQCATCRVQGFASDTIVAPLAGENYGLIENVAAEGSGSVTGYVLVGGLVGANVGFARIINSHSTLNVRAAPSTPLQAFIGNAVLGGLVAQNGGAITNSYATGNVSGGDQSLAGGLVGYSWTGSLTNVYATGSVNINPGVVGSGPARRSPDYNVTSTAGGLVGDVENTIITNAYATGSVSARDGASAGGLAGFIAASTITNAYATGSVTTLGSSNAGGLVGRLNSTTVTNAYATGAISAGTGSLVGGLIGRLDSGAVTNGYWNKESTGQTASAGGGTPLTTAEMTNLSTFRTTYAGFDFNNVWSPPNQAGQGGNATANTPQFYALSKVIWVDADDVSRTYGDANPTLTYALHGLQSGDSASIVTGVSLTGPAATANVGTYGIDPGSPQATGANGVAYRFVNTGDVTVTQRALNNSATIAGIDKVYDGNTTASGGSTNLTAGNNVVNGDVVTLSAASGAYGSADVLGVVSVNLTGVTISNSNYSLGTLSYAGTGSITPKTLTVALTGTVTKTYDGATTAALADANYTVLSGVIAGDVGSVAVNHPAAGNYNDANASVSLKTVTVDGLQLSGGKAGNYTIASSVSGVIGRIDQRQLTGNATVIGIDKTYDSTAAAGSGSANLTTVNNVVTGDTVTLLSASGTYSSANAGARSVTLNAVTLSNSNYTIGTLIASGSGTISQAALTVTAVTDTKVYDGNTSSSGAPTITAGQLYGTDTANFTQAFASRNVLGANGSTLVASGSVNDGNSGNNYAVTFQTAQGTITAAPLTITAATDNRAYNGTASSSGAPTVTSGQVFAGDTGNFAQAFASKNVLGTNGSTLVASGSVSDGNGGNNYALSFQTAPGTITAAPLTITAAANTKTYDGTTSTAATPTASGLVGSDTVTGMTQAYANTNAGTGKTINVTAYTVNDGNGGANYSVQAIGSLAGVIDPATLTYIATPTSRSAGTPNPAFSGTVTGFVGGETLATATTGTMLFTSPADAGSAAGNYAIDGSGLAAANYIFVQSAANATALAVNLVSSTTPSQVTPTTGGNTPANNTNITFQPNTTGPVSISFTPTANIVRGPANDVSPAALPDGAALATNSGHSYLPISQFDENQYSQFKLPGYEGHAGEAAVFTMIARGVDPQNAAGYMIDKFWNGTSSDWSQANTVVSGKVTFTDGAGKAVDPNGNAGFPIVAGSTDFGQMLKNGPVMISDGATPAHWLLATQLTADGKGIVANDPASGKQVVLNYDAATKTVGGVTSVFDTNSNKFVPFAEASAGTPALAGLQGFVPANFLAVMAK